MSTVNKSLIFNEVPTGFPIPGQTTKLVSNKIDLENVPLHGGFLSKSLALDISPYMRGRMRAPSVASYSPPFALGSPIGTLGVSRVLRSENPAFAVGDHVYGYHPMSDYNVFPLTHILPSGLKVFDNLGLSSTVWVGAAGMPGQTAKYGLELANPKAGETIFISACSGAVGQVLCQLSKAMGLKVIGSAGSDEKVAFIKELGVDVAFNYKTTKVQDVLAANPFDIFFDNVGGEQLEAALDHVNTYGRFIMCGSISGYNCPPSQRYPIKNLFHVVAKQLVMSGFIISGKPQEEFYATVPQMIVDGKIKIKEHVTKGLDNGEAFVDLLHGTAFGKAVYSLE